MIYVPLEKILLYSQTIDESFNDCENTYSPSREVISVEDILYVAKEEGVEKCLNVPTAVAPHKLKY